MGKPRKLAKEVQIYEAQEDPRTKVRILKFYLVLVKTSLTDEIDPELLEGSQYFGVYGKVCRLIVKREAKLTQLFLTYYEELDAALAIQALDRFVFRGHQFRISYGYTKYCSHFLKKKCKFESTCQYLHEIDEDHEDLEIDHRQHSLNVITTNLPYFVKKQLREEEEQPICKFPSVEEVLERLISKSLISSTVFNKAKETLIGPSTTKSSSSKNQTIDKKADNLVDEALVEKETKSITPQSNSIQPTVSNSQNNILSSQPKSKETEKDFNKTQTPLPQKDSVKSQIKQNEKQSPKTNSPSKEVKGGNHTVMAAVQASSNTKASVGFIEGSNQKNILTLQWKLLQRPVTQSRLLEYLEPGPQMKNKETTRNNVRQFEMNLMKHLLVRR